MAKSLGSPKTGGRQKGTPNKSTQTLLEVLSAKNVSPLEMILEELPNLDPNKRIGVLLDLMSYIYPKRRPVDISGSFSIDEYLMCGDAKELRRIAALANYSANEVDPPAEPTPEEIEEKMKLFQKIIDLNKSRKESKDKILQILGTK